MEERAAGIGGVFTVLPASRKGTLVKVEVPLVEEKPDLCAES
jgi:signal transduction histidine kinase